MVCRRPPRLTIEREALFIIQFRIVPSLWAGDGWRNPAPRNQGTAWPGQAYASHHYSGLLDATLFVGAS